MSRTIAVRPLALGLLMLALAGCPEDPAEPECTYQGTTHAAGESFPQGDGCNSCGCAADGSVSCTKAACFSDGGPGSDASNDAATPADAGGCV
jgi:hypothetical protein